MNIRFKLLIILIFAMLTSIAFSDTVTFYYRPPSWADASPVSLYYTGNGGNGGYSSMTNLGNGWYRYIASNVTNSSNSMNFELRYWQGANSKTLHESDWSYVNYTTSTDEIWIDGEAATNYWLTSWDYYFGNESAVITDSDPDIVNPAATFMPADGNVSASVDEALIISFNKAMERTDGSAITDFNVDALITLKENNDSGSNVSFDATISVDKTIITITPDSDLTLGDTYYFAIDSVMDGDDLIYSGRNSTFTTGVSAGVTELPDSTKTVNGSISDWDSEETFTNVTTFSSQSNTAYFTWDANYLYFALSGTYADDSGSETYIFIDTDPDSGDFSGDSTPITWGSTAYSPFKADDIIIFREYYDATDNRTIHWYNPTTDHYANVYTYSYSGNDATFDFGYNCREIRIERGLIGNPDKIRINSFTQRRSSTDGDRVMGWPSNNFTGNEYSNGRLYDWYAYRLIEGVTPNEAKHLNETDLTAPTFSSAKAISDTEIEITFSEDVYVIKPNGSDFTSSDFTVQSAAEGSSADKVILTVTSLGDPGFTSSDLDIASVAVRDESGYYNDFAGRTNRTVSDGQVPSYVVNISEAGINAVSLTQTVTIKFNESMSTGVAPSVSFDGGNWGGATGGAWSTTDSANDTYIVNFTHNGNAEYTTSEKATVDASASSDTAGNNPTQGNTESGTFTIDLLPPTAPTNITITPVGGNVNTNTLNTTNTNMTVSATISAGEAEHGQAELLLDGTIIARDQSIGGADTSVTFDIGATDNGELQAAIAAGGTITVRLYDAAANGTTNAGGDDETLTVDYTIPTATITLDSTTPTNANSVAYSVNFSETVTGFTSGDVSVTENLAGTVSAGVADGPQNYTVTLTPSSGTDDGTVSMSVGTGILDSNGNPYASGSSGDYVIDNTAPTVAITYSVDPAKAGAMTITATYDGAIVGTPNITVNQQGSVTNGPSAMSGGATVWTYSYTVNSATGGTYIDGTATATLSAVADSAGNNADAPTNEEFEIDTTAPTATITRDDSATTSLDVVHYSVDFTEDVTGFTTADISVTEDLSGTVVVTSVTGGPRNYTVTLTPSDSNADGDISIGVGVGILDGASNAHILQTSPTYTISNDSVAPTAVIELDNDTTNNLNSVSFGVNFDEVVTGFTTGDVTLDGTLSGSSSVTSVTHDGSNEYTVVIDVPDAGNGTIGITVGTAITDLVGNAYAGGTSALYTIDNTVPTVALSYSADPAKAGAMTITATYNGAVASTPNISINQQGETDITTQAMAGGPTVFTYAYTVVVDNGGTYQDGTATVSLSTVADAGGNNADAPTNTTFEIDTIAPVVTINARTTNDTTPELTGTVDDTGATINVNVSGQDETATNNGNGTWTLADNTLAALGAGTYSVVVTATDGVGNVGTDGTNNELVIDTGAPTVAITYSFVPAKAGALTITATYSEDMVGTPNISINQQGSTDIAPTAMVGGPRIFTYAYTVNASTGGTYIDGTATVSLSTIADPGSNNAAGPTNNTFIIYTTAPTAGIVLDDSTPTNADNINFGVNFDEVVNGFTTADITLGGTLAGTSVTSVTHDGGNQYTVLIAVPAAGNGTVNITVEAGITDDAGNAYGTGTSADYTIDNTAPIVAINALTTNDTTPELTGTVNDNTATITLTVDGQNKTATNNANGTWTLADGQLTALTPGTYEVLVTATDTSGNAGTDVTNNELLIDTGVPTVALSYSANPAKAGAMTITATYSEDMVGTPNISINQQGSTDIAPTAMVGGPRIFTYAYTVNASTGETYIDGTATVSLSTIADPGSNNAADPTNTTFVIDTIAPTATITRDNDAVTNLDAVEYSVDFDEDVTGFTTADIAVTEDLAGTVAVTSVTGGPRNYTVTLTPSDADHNGTISMSVGTGIEDGATNAFVLDTSPSYTIDNTAPTVALSYSATQAKAGAMTITATYSKAIVGTPQISINQQGDTDIANQNMVGGATVWTYSYTVVAQSSPNYLDGLVTVGLSTVADSAGNNAEAETNTTFTIDTIAPSVTVNNLTTNDTTPSLTGTVNDNTAAISVTVNGDTKAAVNNANGTWTLADNQLVALAANTYNISVTATDTAGNIASDGTNNELTIDVTAPTVNITYSANPVKAGAMTITATYSKVVVGIPNISINQQGSTDIIAQAMVGGPTVFTYAYTVVAESAPNYLDGTATVTLSAMADAASNAAGAPTNNTFTIDTTAPTITVTSETTNDTTPVIAGTINDNTATINITVDGQSLAATNNANGTWTLADNALTDLGPGIYNVVANATDTLGNIGTDGTNNELTIDTGTPFVNITYSDASPVDAGALTITATYSEDMVGVPNISIAQPGSVDIIPTAMAGGPRIFTYAYTVVGATGGTYIDGTATVSLTTIADPSSNDAAAPTNNTFVIDTTNPVVTVNSLITNDTTPQLTGSINEIGATISVTIGADTKAAANNGDGTWTLADNQLVALGAGTYELSVTATDLASNTGTDTTNNELEIDLTAPTVNITYSDNPVDAGALIITATYSKSVVGTPNISINQQGTTDITTQAMVGGPAVFTYAYTAETATGGTYVDGLATVSLSAINDTAGNAAGAPINNTFTIDTTDPVVTINNLTTNDTTPQITGTIDQVGTTLSITVNGDTKIPVNNGDGTWTLADNSVAAIPEGVFDASIIATDTSGNTSSDATTNEITIDTTAPSVAITYSSNPTTVGNLIITATYNEDVVGTPNISINQQGTNDLAPTAMVGGPRVFTYTYTVNLDDGGVNLDGIAAVTLSALSDAASNISGAPTGNTFDIDTAIPASPVVTAVSPTTDQTPTWSWTAIAGVDKYRWSYDNTNWTEIGNVLSFTLGVPLVDGNHTLYVQAGNPANNWSPSGSKLVLIDTVSPIVTVNTKVTDDYTPEITGTIDDPTAVINVTVGLQNIVATNNGDGTWILADNVLLTLAEAVYDVVVSATDLTGNIGLDLTSNELIVSTGTPEITLYYTSNPTKEGEMVITAAYSKVMVGTPFITVNMPGDNDIINISMIGGPQIFTYTVTIEKSNGKEFLDGTAIVSLSNISDLIGNLAPEPNNSTFIIDTSVPLAPSIVGTNTGDYNYNQVFTILSEEGATIEYSIDNGENWLDYTGEVTLSEEGTYNIVARATDILGNGPGAIMEAEIVTIDKVAPNAPTVISDAINNNQNPKWNWDAVEDANKYRWSYNGVVWTETNLLEYREIVNLGEGVYTLYVQAGDNAENWSSSSSYEVTVIPLKFELVDVEPVQIINNNIYTTASSITLHFNIENTGTLIINNKILEITKASKDYQYDYKLVNDLNKIDIKFTDSDLKEKKIVYSIIKYSSPKLSILNNFKLNVNEKFKIFVTVVGGIKEVTDDMLKYTLEEESGIEIIDSAKNYVEIKGNYSGEFKIKVEYKDEENFDEKEIIVIVAPLRKLTLNNIPDESIIKVNGKELISTNGKAEISSKEGELKVTVFKPGYYDYTKIVNLDSDIELEVDLLKYGAFIYNQISELENAELVTLADLKALGEIKIVRLNKNVITVGNEKININHEIKLMTSFDIDNDGREELILLNNKKTILLLDWNGYDYEIIIYKTIETEVVDIRSISGKLYILNVAGEIIELVTDKVFDTIDRSYDYIEDLDQTKLPHGFDLKTIKIFNSLNPLSIQDNVTDFEFKDINNDSIPDLVYVENGKTMISYAVNVDINKDGKIGEFELNYIRNNWQSKKPDFDLNKYGDVIDYLDVIIISNLYNE